MTYFLNKPKKVLSLDESSCSWLSAAALVGGVERFGVPGLELGVEVAGVAKGVFDVDVMIRRRTARLRRERGEVIKTVEAGDCVRVLWRWIGRGEEKVEG